MSSQIPYRFGYKNREMTATESAGNFLRSKKRKTLSKINQFPLKNHSSKQGQILGSTRF
jgi:hypothetical protein